MPRTSHLSTCYLTFTKTGSFQVVEGSFDKSGKVCMIKESVAKALGWVSSGDNDMLTVYGNGNWTAQALGHFSFDLRRFDRSYWVSRMFLVLRDNEMGPHTLIMDGELAA